MQSNSRFQLDKKHAVHSFPFLDKAESDKAAAEAEMRELERKISHDRKLREFMKLKSQERQEDEDSVMHRKRKGEPNCFWIFFDQ